MSIYLYYCPNISYTASSDFSKARRYPTKNTKGEKPLEFAVCFFDWATVCLPWMNKLTSNTPGKICLTNKLRLFHICLHCYLLPYSFSPCHDNSYPLTLSNVGEPYWIWICMDHIQVQILWIKFHHCLFTFSIKCKIKHLQSRSCVQTAKKCTKKCDTREKLKFYVLKPFLRSSCHCIVGSISPLSFLWIKRRWCYLM